jgi:phosphoglycolate phosphatase-like HAD superfamily hydrolase
MLLPGASLGALTVTHRLPTHTDTPRASAETPLQAIGIRELFDAVVSSQDARRPKPAPDVFLKAAKQIGIASADCVALKMARRVGGRSRRRHAGGRHSSLAAEFVTC